MNKCYKKNDIVLEENLVLADTAPWEILCNQCTDVPYYRMYHVGMCTGADYLHLSCLFKCWKCGHLKNVSKDSYDYETAYKAQKHTTCAFCSKTDFYMAIYPKGGGYYKVPTYGCPDCQKVFAEVG